MRPPRYPDRLAHGRSANPISFGGERPSGRSGDSQPSLCQAILLLEQRLRRQALRHFVLIAGRTGLERRKNLGKNFIGAEPWRAAHVKHTIVPRLSP
jgi:hypothetical protein